MVFSTGGNESEKSDHRQSIRDDLESPENGIVCPDPGESKEEDSDDE